MHKKAIVGNTVVQFVGKIVTIFLNLIIVYILTHHYSIHDYGEYTAVFSYLLLFNVLADLGLSTILVRDTPSQADKAVFIGNIFLIRLFSLVLSLSLGILIALFIPQYTQVVKIGIVVGSVSSFFLLLTTLVSSIFQLQLKMKFGVLSSTFGVFANLILLLFVIEHNLSIDWAIAAVSAAYIFMFILSFILAWRVQSISFKLDKLLWKPILMQSMTVGGTIIFSTIYFKADSVILSLMRPYSDVSLYGVPYRILEVLISIPQMFMAPVFAIMSTLLAENKIEEFKNMFQKSADILLLGAFPIIPGALFLSHKIIPLYAGVQYATSADILNILSIAIFISFIGSSYIFVILALKEQSYLFYWNIILSIFNIILNIICIPHFGYWASAWITVATELLVMIGSIYVVRKTFRFIPNMGIALKALLSVVVFTLILYLTSPFNLFTQALLASLGYLCMLVLLNAIPLEDMREIMRELY